MKPIAPAILLVLCLCALPSSGAILEVTVRGTVSGLSLQNNTLTIADPARYGCSYPPGGAADCSYTPMDNTSTLTGSIPAGAGSAFEVFSEGDSIVATSLGGPGGSWIALAKLAGTAAPDEFVTDIVGDPSSIPVPLAGSYGLELSTEPDCTTCTGTTCTAATSLVRVMSGESQVLLQDLTPGHSLVYNGRNDGSVITVTFVRGQASSSTCAGRDGMMTGPQPISVYVVHVTPPIGSGGQSLPSTPQQVTMPSGARPTTARSGMLPAAGIGAVALGAVLSFRRR